MWESFSPASMSTAFLSYGKIVPDNYHWPRHHYLTPRRRNLVACLVNLLGRVRFDSKHDSVRYGARHSATLKNGLRETKTALPCIPMLYVSAAADGVWIWFKWLSCLYIYFFIHSFRLIAATFVINNIFHVIVEAILHPSKTYYLTPSPCCRYHIPCMQFSCVW